MPQERSKPFPIPASWTMQLPELRCQDWMLPPEAQKLPRLESLWLQLFLTVLWSSKRIHGILRSQHTSTWKCLKCSLPERSCLLPAAQCSEGNEEHYSKIIKPRKLANKVCKASMGKKKPLLAQIGKNRIKTWNLLQDPVGKLCWGTRRWFHMLVKASSLPRWSDSSSGQGKSCWYQLSGLL